MAKRRATGPAPAPRRLGLAVFGATLLVYLPSLANGFVNWDDDRNFLENAAFRGLAPENLRWAFETFLLGHWHPLTWLSLQVDYALWGMNPAGYHFTNALLHSATAALAYLLFVELLVRARGESRASGAVRAAAAVGALFFALHPLRVESVAWASERRDVLCGVFSLATVLLYVRDRARAALAAFAAALLSKVLAATLPVTLLVLDVYPLRRPLGWRTLAEKAPFFALALAAGLIGVGRYEGGVAAAAHDLDLHLGLRLTLSAFGLAFYLVKTALPWGLYPQYVWSLDPLPTDALLLAGAALAGAATLAAILAWRLGGRAPAAAWAAYVVTLLPVLSFIRLDRQQAVNDHHSYLPSVALAALAAGGWLLWRERGPRSAALAAGAVFVALAALTVRQIGFWRDSETLWARTVAAYPLSVTARNNLGRALADAGRPEAAIDQFRAAVELQPGFLHARYNLASLEMAQGRYAEAEGHLRRLVEREPRMAPAWSDLGNALLRQGRAVEAIEAYDRALEAAPGHADARHNREIALRVLAEVSGSAPRP